MILRVRFRRVLLELRVKGSHHSYMQVNKKTQSKNDMPQVAAMCAKPSDRPAIMELLFIAVLIKTEVYLFRAIKCSITRLKHGGVCSLLHV